MKSEIDNKEWLNEYMSLKQVNPDNPFAVPAGYFDELQGQVMSAVFLEGLAKETGFTTPGDYFDALQNDLQSRINIETALHNSTGDFTVPDNYFATLGEQISSRIMVEESMNGRAEGFAVPDGYFDKLQGAILDKTVKTVQREQQRRGVIRKLISSGAFKYATAACLVLGIGTTLFFNNYESPEARHKRSYVHKELSTVSDADIIDYLQMHMDAADTRSVMDDADQLNTYGESTDEIKDYLSTH